jgi:hypothetical protein
MNNIEQIQNKDILPEDEKDLNPDDNLDKEIDENKNMEKKDGKKKEGSPEEIRNPKKDDPDTKLNATTTDQYKGNHEGTKFKTIENVTVAVDTTQADVLNSKAKLLKEQNDATAEAKKKYLAAQKEVPDVKEEETSVSEDQDQKDEVKQVPVEDPTAQNTPAEGDQEYVPLKELDLAYAENQAALDKEGEYNRQETVEQLNTFAA